MMKKLLFLSLLLTPYSLSLPAQTKLTDSDLSNAYTTKTVSGRIVCHDPSVFIDNITDPSNPKYYIYGSHLGRGYTTEASNYQTWTNYTSWSKTSADENATTSTKSLFCNTSGNQIIYSSAYNTHAIKQVKDCNGNTVTFGNFNAHNWQYTGNSVAGNEWAPDVIYNKTMKKWCMYMSLNGDYWCSSIVCFTSDSPQGPWMYQGPVVFSGFKGGFKHVGFDAANDYKHTDLEIAIGAQTSLPSRYAPSQNYGNYWPNCIDPCVFYDDDNNLWMSYGSWSGGIWMLKLNPENGLRDYTYKFPYERSGKTATPGGAAQDCTSDPYFGKKIAGGYYVSGEASYIKKIGKYYFLFMSYGNLNAYSTDKNNFNGYQIRVFRSDSPTGPYKDPTGTSAIYTAYALNYSANMTDYRGMLLFGGFKWDTMTNAELSQGHNSAMVDLKGRAMVVYHTRFNTGNEGHQVRVHQLFLNEDGWISASPFEFHGETITNDDIASKASIADADIPGDYQFLRHEYKQDTKNQAYEKPVNITLNADGTISGNVTGTWQRTAGTDFITLTISNVAYKGVLVKQTIDFTNVSALCIAATSGSNGSAAASQTGHTRQQEVWAVKADYKAAIKYTLDKTTVPFNNGATVSTKPSLPATGYLGANINWTSSDQSVMADDGTIKGNGSTTMTMHIVKDGYEYTKDYTLTVNGSGGGSTPVTPSTTTTYYPVSSEKTTTAAWWTNFSMADYTLVVGKTMQFQFYNYSNKANNWDNWCLYGASATHGASSYTEYFGIRCDNWDNTTGSNTGCSSNFNWDTFKEEMDGSFVDMTVTYNSAYIFNMSAKITTTTGTVYTYNYSKTLSSKPAVINLFFVSEGSYIDGSSISGIETPLIYRPQSNVIYNISGQRIGSGYKGVVIRDGHKYIQK